MTDVKARLLDGIPSASGSLLAGTVKQYQQHASFSTTASTAHTQVGTVQVAQVHCGMVHNEGGWPREISADDENKAAKFRQKCERNIAHISRNKPSQGARFTTPVAALPLHQCLKPLASTLAGCIRTNSSANIFETYYEGETIHKNVLPSAEEIALFSDPNLPAARTVGAIEWHPDGTKFGAAYCNISFQDEAQRSMSMDSYLWDITRPIRPLTALTPPSPLCCLNFNPRQTDLIAAGCYNGLVCVFDTRKGEMPIEASVIESSHRDPVYGVAWTQSKTGHNFVSASTDGRLLWWDYRRLSEPIEEVLLYDRRKPTPRLCGARALAYDSTLPHRYTVGTEQGMVMNVHRRAKRVSAQTKANNPPEKKKASSASGQTRDPRFGAGMSESGGNNGSKRSSKNQHQVFSNAHLSSIVAVDRHPHLPTYFLTAGDWRVQIWAEDLSSPIITTRHHSSPLTASCWSSSRPGVFFVGRTDGRLDIWDLYEQQSDCSYSHRVSDAPLSAVSVQPYGPQRGQLVAVGTENSRVHLLRLSRGLSTQQTAERSAMANMLERETVREKNMQVASKKKRRQGEELAEIERKRAEELDRRQKHEDGMDTVLGDLDQQFLALLKGRESSAPTLKSGTVLHKA